VAAIPAHVLTRRTIFHSLGPHAFTSRGDPTPAPLTRASALARAAGAQAPRVGAAGAALITALLIGTAELAAWGIAGESPRRVISIIPATTEMLFAMGAGDRVVAVSSYDHFPPEVDRLPRVGALIDPNVERILTLKPDLVVVYDTQAELKQQLERAGIPYFSYAHHGVPDITQTIRALGARVGVEAGANALANRIDRQLADIRARVSGLPRPKTLLVFGRERGTLRNIDASGGYGFLHDMLEIAGADDVLADLKRQSVMMSTEMVLARAPEVIIELQYGAALTPEQVKTERAAWNALPSVPAVRNGRVYLLQGDEFVVPGPRVVGATEQLAKTLHQMTR
jgi:iron complex transport system substrate-binding protein